MPSASLALARSTKRRVMSSGLRAFSRSLMTPPCAGGREKSNAWSLWLLESAVMELRQLEYFVAVAQEENFTRAAERVHISQSGVSAQIKALETELGARLFERSGRTARL